jgi:hypothetical protein
MGGMPKTPVMVFMVAISSSRRFIVTAALSLLVSARAVQAGMLGHSIAEYRDKYVEPFVGSNPDVHLFKGEGLEVNVIFYKDQAIFVELRKQTGEAFSDAEIQMELQQNPEGSAWNFEGGAWVNEHGPGTIPSALANVNADKTSLTILNPKATIERKLDKISSELNNFGKDN